MYDSQLNGVTHDGDLDMGGPHPTKGATVTNGATQQQQQQKTVNMEPRKPNKVRITTPYLTKYERARILGTRALQIRFVYSSILDPFHAK